MSDRIQTHKRLYAAMALNSLLEEVPLASVSEDFELSRGQLQQLQSSAAQHGAMVCLFCEAMEWWGLSLVLGQVQERIGHGVAVELTGLASVPHMTSTYARSLFDGGLTDVAQLAVADVSKVAQILQKNSRGGNRKLDPVATGGRDEVCALRRRMQSRTAKLLVRNAKRIAIQSGLTLQPQGSHIVQQQSNPMPFQIVDVSHSAEAFSAFQQDWRAVNEFAWQPVLEVGEVRGMMVCISSKQVHFLPFFAQATGSNEKLAFAREMFLRAEASKVCFNAKAAMKALAGLIEVSGPLDDPMLAAGLLHASGESQDVRSLHEAYCGDSEASSWPPEKALGSGRLGVAALAFRSLQIHRSVMACLAQHKMVELYRELEMPLVPVLFHMETLGIGFSVEESAKLSERIEDTQQALHNEINLIAGRSVQVTSKRDVCDAIAECVGDGELEHVIEVLASDAASLEHIAATSGHRMPILVILYRKVGAVQRAMNSAQLHQQESGQTDRLHTTYLQAGNVTGRIYTDNPNLQCMPNELQLETCSQCNLTIEQEIRAGSLPEGLTEDNPWLVYVLPATSEPTMALATAVFPGSGMNLPLSHDDPRTLIDYWSSKGLTYSEADAHSMATVTIKMACANRQLTFPADRVWRCHGSMTISPRDVFVASSGYTFISADFRQIELRVAAHMAKDSRLLQVLNDPTNDVFHQLHAQWHGVPVETVTSSQRKVAKRVCYGILYGMGAGTLAHELSCTRDEASAHIASFMSRFSGVRAYFQHTVALCRKCGYVTTWKGRRRYIPAISSPDKRDRSQAERQAVNTVLQGSAAELMKLAMVRVHQRLAGQFVGQAAIVMQLHDELLVEVRLEQLESVKAILQHEMENVAKLDVALPVQVRTGPTWGSLS